MHSQQKVTEQTQHIRILAQFRTPLSKQHTQVKFHIMFRQCINQSSTLCLEPWALHEEMLRRLFTLDPGVDRAAVLAVGAGNEFAVEQAAVQLGSIQSQPGSDDCSATSIETKIG